jgi:uncharacterized membrane protein YeiH
MHFSFINIIDILGTFSFAVSGAFAAMEKKLDPFGVLIICFVTAIGGGTLRDVLIGDLPVAWLSNLPATIVIIVGAIATLFFGGYLKKLDRMLFLFDAIGLGLFTMIGIEKGIDHHLNMAICIMLGTVTGCFGGVLRDVLLNNVPLIFKKEIYAIAGIFGGCIFFLLLNIHIDRSLAYILGITLIVITRVLAVQFKLSIPKFYEKKKSSGSVH